VHPDRAAAYGHSARTRDRPVSFLFFFGPMYQMRARFLFLVIDRDRPEEVQANQV
jgi:hypothetical protein